MDGHIAAQKPLGEIYMHTANGNKYYPFAPKPEDVSIEVIAHHLATRGRWAGATQHKTIPSRIFYSVAEHSVYVARYVEEVMGRPDLALEALLHDGAESYNGDLIRPLKYSAEFREPFKKVETLNEAAVSKAFYLPVIHSPEVKVADDAVCYAEFVQIVPMQEAEEWSNSLTKTTLIAPFQIEMLAPYEAKMLFLHHYMRLLSMMRTCSVVKNAHYAGGAAA